MSSQQFELSSSLSSPALGVTTPSVELGFPATVVTPISYSVMATAAGSKAKLKVVVKNVGSQAVTVNVTGSSKYILLDERNIP